MHYSNAKCIGYNGYKALSLQKCIIHHKTALCIMHFPVQSALVSMHFAFWFFKIFQYFLVFLDFEPISSQLSACCTANSRRFLQRCLQKHMTAGKNRDDMLWQMLKDSRTKNLNSQLSNTSPKDYPRKICGSFSANMFFDFSPKVFLQMLSSKVLLQKFLCKCFVLRFFSRSFSANSFFKNIFSRSLSANVFCRYFFTRNFSANIFFENFALWIQDPTSQSKTQGKISSSML